MVSTLLSASLSRLGVEISVQVVVVHVLWVIDTSLGPNSGAVSTIGHVVPTSLRLVSKKDVGSVLPAQPAGHLVGQLKHLILRVLVEPVVHWAVVVDGVDVDVAGEFALKTGIHVVERKGVGSKVDPARVSSKEAESVAGPEAVPCTPGGDVGLLLFGVAVESLHVVPPCHLLGVKILLEDAAPFGASDVSLKVLDGLVGVHATEVHVPCELDVLSDFLISSVVGLVDWTSLKVDNSSEPVHVVNGSNSSDFGTEAVSTDCCHCDFIVIHKTYNIVSHFIEII